MASTEDVVSQEQFDGVPNEKLLEILRSMLMSRRFEEKTAESYQVGKIGGFCHLYIGQEAVAAGAMKYCTWRPLPAAHSCVLSVYGKEPEPVFGAEFCH